MILHIKQPVFLELCQVKPSLSKGKFGKFLADENMYCSGIIKLKDKRAP